jgi:hypothetical protein
MSDFEALLNKEIVDSGRVPDARVISRALRLSEVLEDYFEDRNTLTPVVSPNEDVITWRGTLDEKDSGFDLTVSIRPEDKSVEEELVVWYKADNIYLSIRGTLAVRDFEYALKRDKEYAYLSAPIED